MTDDFSSEVFSIERDGPVATLWLDNAERRNVMGPPFFEGLPRAMDVLSCDPEVRAVVIAAKGKMFSAGLDLKTAGSLTASSPDDSQATHRARIYQEIKRLQASVNAVADCPKPVIAAVHGYCLGGGIDLITACDIRLAAADAIFSVRETKIAIVADLGTLQRLPRVIAAGHAAELIYTGKDIDAARAKEIGLINDVHADAEATVAAAHAMAAEIAANSPIAVQGAKAVVTASAEMTVEQGLDYVAVWNSAFLLSNDLMEGAVAFMEKRPPRFEGR